LFLFIFESIGTSELLLIGVVALIFLGPRRMPEMARKLGKIMSEFRGTANEFKQTWQREVDFEEEKKAFDISDLEAEPVKRVESITVTETVTVTASEPAVREVDPDELEKLKAAASVQKTPQTDLPIDDPNDKRNWL
jgi:Tat protein translocase TatB subunit